MDQEQYARCEFLGACILESFEAGAWQHALELWLQADLDADERVHCWHYFDSRQRAFLKGADRKYNDDYYR